MFTVYFTGLRTQIAVTVPVFVTALYLMTHTRCPGRRVRIWSHVAKRFV